MRCETCQGRGWVRDQIPMFTEYPNAAIRHPKVPCPDCGGCGVAHCCDGLTAANETPEPEPPAD